MIYQSFPEAVASCFKLLFRIVLYQIYETRISIIYNNLLEIVTSFFEGRIHG